MKKTMKNFKVRNRTIGWYFGGFILLLLAGLLTLKMLVPNPGPQFTVTISAEEMVFRHGERELRFPAGARISLTFRNQDRGVTHQMAIPSLGVETPVLQFGDEFRETVTLPKQRTTLRIECPLHPMMTDSIFVETPFESS